MNTITKTLATWGKRLVPASILSLVAFGGFMSASATGTPQFNFLSNDYPTLQVAKSGGAWSSSASVSPGETVSMLIWVHNGVVDTTAQNTRARLDLPTASATSHQATARVWADNASTVTGSVTLNSGTESILSYVQDSAQLLTNIDGHMTVTNWPTGVNKNDVATQNGVSLGDINGCWQYAKAIMVQVRVDGTTPGISTNKRVQLLGGAPYDMNADAQPGDTVSFKIYVENTGTGTARNPMVVDTLESRLAYVPASSYMLVKKDNQDFRVDLLDSKIKFEGQTITWAFDDMAPGAQSAFYLIFKAKVADNAAFPVGKTILNNKAKASFTGINADTNNVTVTVTRAAEPVVSFTLRKEVTNRTLGDSLWYDERLASAAPGDTVSFRLIVINTGNTPAQNVTLKDILPAGISFVGNVKLYNIANPNGTTIPGDAIVKDGYVFPTLKNGSSELQTIIFDAKLTDQCSGTQTLVNKGQVIWQGQVRAEDTASAIFTCNRGLVIQKDVRDPKDNTYKDDIGIVTEGQVLTYRITVVNNGNVTAAHPILRDVLPQGVNYVNNSLAVDGEFQNATNQQAFFNQGIMLTTLTPGLGKTVTFQVRIPDCPQFGDTPILNTAFVKADSIAEISDTARAVIRVTRPQL